MRIFRRRPPVSARVDDSPMDVRMPSTFADALASAGHTDIRVRAAAGVVLASSPNLDPITDVLMRLLLDPEDTFVTSETADALVGRRDVSGMRLVVSALSRADESTANWIRDVVLENIETPEEYAARISALEALRYEPDVAADVEDMLDALKG